MRPTASLSGMNHIGVHMTLRTLLAASVVAVSAGALTGCAGALAPNAASTTDEARAGNRTACSNFGGATLELGTLLTTSESELGGFDAYKTRIDAVPDSFDKASLQATGVVAERMTKAIDALPDELGDILLDSDEYNRNVKSVYNACEAEDADVSKFSTLE